MKNEKIDKKDSEDFEAPDNNDEVFKFGYLINVILDYYMSEEDPNKEGESWKKGTEHEQKAIPEEIDAMIEEAFKYQLSKFIKPN